MEQKLVIDPKQVVTNFCWGYCNALLQKAIELSEKDKIFIDGENAAIQKENESSERYPSELTDIAHAVFWEICEQVHIRSNGGSETPTFVKNVMLMYKEYLDIFHKS